MEERRVLESWKEISDYLRRSIKTCRRWEVELELPVHRLDGTPKARVFAFPDELDAWLSEKPALKEAAPEETDLARPARHRRMLVAACGIVVLAGIIFGVRRMLPSPPLPVPSPKPSLAVLYFENPTGDESLEAWRHDLPYLIMLDLTQSRFIDVVNPSLIGWGFDELKLREAKTYSPADLMNVAQKIAEVADFREPHQIVTGNLLRSGDRIIVTVSVQKPGPPAEPQSFQTVCRDEKDMMAKVDGLTREIKRSLGLSRRYISHDIDAKVTKIATPSPQAFHIYCEALWAPYKEGEGRRELAPLLKQALEIDLGFALAHESIYKRSTWGGREHERKTYLRKAFDLSRRLSVKDRLMTRGDFYRECKEDWGAASRAWEKLWTLYPGDWQVRYSLFKLYMHAEEWDKAISLLEDYLTKNGRSIKDNDLAACYAGKGMYDKAEKLLADSIDSMSRGAEILEPHRLFYFYVRRDFQGALDCLERAFPSKEDSVEYCRRKGMHYYYQDDYSAAEREFRRIRELDPTDLGGLDLEKLIFFDQGKIEEAKRFLSRAVEEARKEKSPDWEAGFHADLAHLNCLTADFAEARREIEGAAQAQSKWLDELGQYDYFVGQYEFYLCVLHERALISLEMDDLGSYESDLKDIREASQKGAKRPALRRYYHLLGQRELKNGSLSRAIAHFEMALSLHPSQYPFSEDDLHRYYFSLAGAYEQAGNLEKARTTYERLLRLMKLELGDMYARSFYRLGKIYEQLGDRGKAIENYRKFLSLWKDADPVFSEVPDAKMRLAGLESR